MDATIGQTLQLVRALLLLAVCGFATVSAEPVSGEHGIAATGHPLATQAALEAIKRGGNAIDAAIAAGLTLGVVDGSNSGIGGGCFLLIRTSAGENVAIDGRERAPAAATAEMFVREGKADTSLSQTGALAVGTPGALAAYQFAVEKYGKLPLKSHLLAAAEVADAGFVIGREYARRSASEAQELARFDAARAIFLKPDGAPLAEGDTLQQPDLARSYRAIAEHGTAWFYDGAFAERTGEWMAANGGVLTADDFKAYRISLREPVRSTYRGYEVISFPPPSSGGVHLLQILNILEEFDLRSFGHNSADALHVIGEAMKLGFADRAHWLGDPEFTPVPRGLIAKEYARTLAARIRMEQSSEVAGHGTPERAAEDVFGKHTTHFSVADAAGNWVACTATINTAFGSKVVVPGTGVLLNNQMDDFSLQPGVPNAFQLIGGEANAVAPGKRPLSSMCPTIVAKEGKPLLALGAAGGPTIITQTALAIVNVVDYELDVEAALRSPRIHQQWRPDELRIETAIDATVREELERRGHKLAPSRSFGATQAVGRNDLSFTGAADPRNDGTAAGW